MKKKGGVAEEDLYFTEMYSGSEAGSYSTRIDFAYHSTLGLRVIKEKKWKKEDLTLRAPPQPHRPVFEAHRLLYHSA